MVVNMLRSFVRCDRRAIAFLSHTNGSFRCISSNESFSNRNSPAVCKSKDDSMFLCWHPETPFPYEFSRSLPRRPSEVTEGDSILKTQFTAEEKAKYRPDGPTQQELMKIFHTTRHAFDPKPGRRHRKPNPPKDRDSI